MATVAHPQTSSVKFLEWFPEFLRSELAPYPGRAAAVTRITLAAVITVILVSTFRIPGAAIAVYNVFTVTRDSPTAAIRSALVSVGAITAGLALSMAGVFLFIDSQLIYFIFTVFEFFMFFWLTRVVVQPGAAINIGMAVYNVSNIWALPYPAQQHVEATLWFWAAMVLGIVVAAVVEVFFVRVDPINVLLTGVDERLGAAEGLIAAYLRNSDDQGRTLAKQKIINLAVVGTGGLRRQLRSAENGHAILRQYLVEISSVIALSGRLVDLLANTALMSPHPAEIDRERFERLRVEIGQIRNAIQLRQRPDAIELGELRHSIESPLLPEIEKVVSLIPQAFSPAQTLNAAVVSEIDETPKTRWLVADAFSNHEYIRFALKGCLAATICYVIYTAIDWPGISTSVVTCMVTSLSTVGASRQKQFLRISGAMFGGLLALLSIVLLLPNMERITPVVLLVAAVTAASAWVATSSPRLSYFGLQTILAFYITVLQDYTAPTTLSPARDRFVGVLLGLIVMWIVDQSLWPSHAANAMLEKLRENIRQVARLVGAFDETEGDRLQLLPAIRRLREIIDAGFQIVQEHAGTILFEFGPDRSADLEKRERALRVQASIRTVFLLEIAILQYRIQSDTRMIPSQVRQAQLEFNNTVEARLNKLADTIPGSIGANGMTEVRAAEDKLQSEALGWYKISGNEDLLARVRGVVSLSNQMVTVLEDI